MTIMHALVLLSSIVLLVSTVFAAPRQYVTSVITLAPPEPTIPPMVPKTAGVYVCSDDNFNGTCFHQLSVASTAPNACVYLDGTATSVGPDPGFVCWFFTNSFCDTIRSGESDVLELRYPGSPNVGFTDKGNFNDRLRSYYCLETVNIEPPFGHKTD